MRIVFAGTPEFSVPSLGALISATASVVAVYCQPDRRAGRGRKISFGPVKTMALKSGIDVYQPVSFDDAAIRELKSLAPDLIVVAAYGLLLPKAVLAIPALGCVNVHASVLPRWRGAAPVARAIENGDTKSGITLMQMDEGLDTGDILFSESLTLEPREDAISLHDRLAALGATVLGSQLPSIESRLLSPVPQDSETACYAHKLKKSEAPIDWSLPVETIDRRIRAFKAWPVASTRFNNETWKIFDGLPTDLASPNPGQIVEASKFGLVVGCGDRCLRITELQRPGGKRQLADVFINGLKNNGPNPGDSFNHEGTTREC